MKYAVVQIGQGAYSDAHDTREAAIAEAAEWTSELLENVPDWSTRLFDGDTAIINSDDEIWSDYIDDNGKIK